MSSNKWKKLSSKIVYTNPWFKVREDLVITPVGKKGTYTVVEKKRSVFIVAITEQNELYLIDQFRYTTNMESWEIPAGAVESNEAVMDAAKRELQEETGLQSMNWVEIGIMQLANDTLDGIGHIFIASGLQKVNINEQKEEGIDSVEKFLFADTFSMIKNGKMTDSHSIAAITLASVYLGIIPLTH